MAYCAKIIEDSVSPCGKRLTTMELTYPRFVHSEFMTHRLFSRNAASSRAIPISKMIQAVQDDPVLPVWWGKAQSGMQAREEIEDIERAKASWLGARTQMIHYVEDLLSLGLHKQIPNRILEPWSWITIIVSATEWQNFFRLRCHPDAQPEIQKIAYMAKELYDKNEPVELVAGSWHMPYIHPEDWDLAFNKTYSNDMKDRQVEGREILRRVSVARCARVSYLTHDGKRDLDKDLELFERLKTSGHWSPFEHVAMALNENIPSGNFYGWQQFRKTFQDECADKNAGLYLDTQEVELLRQILEDENFSSSLVSYFAHKIRGNNEEQN